MTVLSGITDLCMNDPTDSSPEEDHTVLLIFPLMLNPSPLWPRLSPVRVTLPYRVSSKIDNVMSHVMHALRLAAPSLQQIQSRRSAETRSCLSFLFCIYSDGSSPIALL